MKQVYLKIAIAMLMALGTMPLYAQPPAGYTLVRADEFNGSSLDGNLWIPYYLESRTTQERAAARYSFRDGCLVLRIDQDQPTYYPDNPMKVSSIQTGQRSYLHKDQHNHNIPTTMNYTPQYGYFEIRAKTVNQTGYHCAFWTVGRRDESWQEAEFDIMEQYGNGSRNRFNLIGWDDGNIADNTYDHALGFNPSADFHTYGIEWTPSGIRFYIDGNLMRTVNQSPNYGMVFFLSIYENAGWTGSANTGSGYPREFIIDYFRAYAATGGGGNYSIINRNSGKALDVSGWSTSDNGNIIQWAYTGGNNQKWQLQDLGNGYYNIVSNHSGKCLRSLGGNIIQYTCNSSYWSEQFERISQDGYYQLRNRNTGNCVQVADGSASDGANIEEGACNSSWWRQHFSFNSVSARSSAPEAALVETGVRIYPDPVSSVLSLDLPKDFVKGEVNIVDLNGKVVWNTNLTEKSELDVSALRPGVYFLRITNDIRSLNIKFIKSQP